MQLYEETFGKFFMIRLKEACLMMGFSMDKLVERAGGAITKQSISPL